MNDRVNETRTKTDHNDSSVAMGGCCYLGPRIGLVSLPGKELKAGVQEEGGCLAQHALSAGKISDLADKEALEHSKAPF